MAEENEKKSSYWEFFFKKEWSYVTGAVLLAIFATAFVIVNGGAWGVTGPFANWGANFLMLFGVSPEALAGWAEDVAGYDFFKSHPSLTNIGIILGALLSVLLAASFKFKKIKSLRQVAAAILGGTLMGIGARLALGCNIGAFFSAIPGFSLHGWVFLVFIFLGAGVGSLMLKKWFM